MLNNGFAHLDPTTTYIYRHHRILYGFETVGYCFSCHVVNGYLTGKRDSLPEKYMWVIGQHIDTIKQYVENLMPLRLVPSRQS